MATDFDHTVDVIKYINLQTDTLLMIVLPRSLHLISERQADRKNRSMRNEAKDVHVNFRLIFLKKTRIFILAE